MNVMKSVCVYLFPLLILTCYSQERSNVGEYNILDYGAKKDSSFLSSEAINQAITDCSANGGGRVVIPAGKYKSGTILMKDHVELYFEPGSYLCASVDPKDICRQPRPEYRSEKEQGGWYALIYAEKANDIAISGYGIIDGRGAQHKSRPECLWGDQDGRPRNILFISCSNVNISGITMINAGIWNQHYLNCEDVYVNNVKVINHSNSNNDGINIDGCRRFFLTNSNIDSDDDGIVLKSTGLSPCKDVVIDNCIVSSHANGIKLGTESTGGFRNVVVSNCIVKPSRITTRIFPTTLLKGITGISLEIVDGGVMDGISVNNIIVEGTECPLYIRLGSRGRKHTKDSPEPPMGQMRNIQISNILAYGTGNFCSSITGVPEGKIENVYLDNIRFFNRGGLKNGEYLPDIQSVIEDEKGYPQPTVWGNLPSSALFIRHVENIHVTNAVFGSDEPDPRIPIVANDVDYLQLSKVYFDFDTDKKDVLMKDVKQYSIDKNIDIEE